MNMYGRLAATSACAQCWLLLANFAEPCCAGVVFMHINECTFKNAHPGLSILAIMQQWL